jgi:hypothetical protein
MDNVTNGTELCLPSSLGVLGLCHKVFFGLGQLLLFSNKLSRIFLCLELFADFLLEIVDLLIYFVTLKLD